MFGRADESGYFERRDLFAARTLRREHCTRYFEVAEWMKIVGIE